MAVLILARLLLLACVATGSRADVKPVSAGNDNSLPAHLKYCNWKNPRRPSTSYSDAALAALNADVADDTNTAAVVRDDRGSRYNSQLPTAGPGEACGAAIAICRTGLCCGQTGFCSSDPVACDGTCQCDFSGVRSKCKGAFPPPTPNPYKLPVAQPNGACGTYLARCPTGQCCTQFGVCQADDSKYCSEVPTCQADLSSATSTRCRELVAKLPRRVRRYTLVATEGVRAPDGFTRTVILLNGEFPGPTLTADVGDRIVLTFINKMNSSASIHMHGMLQRTSNAQDGAVPITQRDVGPGETFIYNYMADAPGTFWYHSHYRTQYTDGLKGNLLIRDPFAATYSAEPSVTVSDWYHVNSKTVTDAAMFNYTFLTPNSTLINGIGQSVYCGSNCSYAFVKGFASSCDNPQTRLRLLNTGGGSMYNVSIDNHRMIVVAADGVSVKAFEVGSLQINAGQRYDVLLCQRPAAGSRVSRRPVWIRAGIQLDNTPVTFSTAVLYFGESPPSKLPTATADYQGPILSVGDVSDAVNPSTLQANVLPPSPTKTVRYVVEFFDNYLNGMKGLYGHMNNISLQMSPNSPSLLERYSNNPQNLPPPAPISSGLGWHVVEVKEGDVIDVILDNEDGGEHPIHLHGHWSWVMGSGAPFEGKYKGQELNPSVIRDTLTIANKSWLVLRFIADNPGAWILHCHIDKHLAMGMGIIFREAI